MEPALDRCFASSRILLFVVFAEHPAATLARRWDVGTYRQVMTKPMT